MIGWAYLSNSETKNISIIDVMQGFSPLGRADCSLRAEEAYGEQFVASLIANKQVELERGVEQCFDNNGSPPSHAFLMLACACKELRPAHSERLVQLSTKITAINVILSLY